MPCPLRPNPLTLHGARCLLAACACAWASGGALAQQATVDPDPLAPQLQTSTRQPPRFQPFTPRQQAQLAAPPSFSSPPASGAGITGFDSTNSRDKIKARPPTRARSGARAIAPGLPEPLQLSAYQKATPAAGALAQAPGAPPVDIGPIRQPIKKRKAHTEPEDPYAPLGVHAGAFTLLPAVELIGGYDSNPARGPGGSGASFYTVAPELQAQSNWSRHELKAELRGSYTGYSPDSTPTLSRPNFSGKVDGRIDVTRNTRVDLGSRILVGTDDPGSPNLPAGLAKLPIYTTFGGTAGIGHTFNRLDLSLKGDVERTVWQDSSLVDGSSFSNKDRQYNQYTGKFRAGYETMPGVKPFVEISADSREHDLNVDVSGFQRDSKGVTALVGTSFDLRGTLTGEVAVGYAQRTYEDPRLEMIPGLVGQASLIWTADALNTVKLTANSTINESTLPGVSGVFTREVGVQYDHSFRRWLIGTLKFGYGVDSYKGGPMDAADLVLLCDCVLSTPGGVEADRVDQRYYLGAGLTYKLNRSVQLKGEFRQEWLRSNVANVDYAASIFMLGLRLQR